MSKPIKKCPECGKWSEWDHGTEDRCEHCGSLLSPREYEESQKPKEKDKFGMELNLIKIKEKDSPVLVFFKRIIQGFQLLFFGIVSFLVWLATAIAG